VNVDLENETWIVERGGDVVERMADPTAKPISELERVIYCLWVADYGMRNAGDLDTAIDLYPAFQTEGMTLARTLGLAKTSGMFSLGTGKLEKRYFELLTDVRLELQSADALSPNTSLERTRER
jgi:hypothetical protein